MFQAFFANRHWAVWAYGGGLLLLLGIAAQVGIDVAINEWFGKFYNLIQTSLAQPNGITIETYWSMLADFGKLAALYVFIAILVDFLIKHWVFRWRTAMNNFYLAHWEKLRMVEGAAQRVQEDTMRFARLMETLGANLLRCIMTLAAFVPILATLSKPITELPGIGHVSQALIWVAILFALFGTLLMALVGFKLPGLEFNNQKVEAAFRKELVYGEDDPMRAQPATMGELFGAIRKNYLRLYFHYLYVDFTKWSYLQAGVLLPYIALGPSLVGGALTLGSLQQIVRAFGRVENALQYMVMNWYTVVDLISVYKRLQAFERRIHAQ